MTGVVVVTGVLAVKGAATARGLAGPGAPLLRSTSTNAAAIAPPLPPEGGDVTGEVTHAGGGCVI